MKKGKDSIPVRNSTHSIGLAGGEKGEKGTQPILSTRHLNILEEKSELTFHFVIVARSVLVRVSGSSGLLHFDFFTFCRPRSPDGLKLTSENDRLASPVYGYLIDCGYSGL